MNRRRDERGAVAVIVSLFTCFVLFTICALVVDLGFARDQKQASQVSSDAAALAGANVLYRTGGTTGCSVSPCFAQAVAAVEAYTTANFSKVTTAMWSSCADTQKGYVYTGTLPTGAVTTNCVSFFNDANAANSTQPTKVRVVTPTVSNPTFFGGITGVNTVSISTSARAKLQPGQNRSCGLCLLGTVPNNVGNGSLDVDGASIHTNGSFDVNSMGEVVATPAGSTTITTAGSAGCNQNCSPAATSASVITDPYLTNTAVPPDWSALTYKTGPPCTYVDNHGNTIPGGGPGIYLNDYTFPNATCTLASGLYVVAGTWTGGNNTVLKGTNVTLYFTCSSGPAVRNCMTPGETGGQYNMKVGVAVLTAPIAGQTKGFVLVYDRNNKSDITIQGNGGTTPNNADCHSLTATETSYTGTIYAPMSQLTFPGTSAITVTNGPVITGSVYSNGNKACMDLTNATGAQVYVQPSAPNLDQ